MPEEPAPITTPDSTLACEIRERELGALILRYADARRDLQQFLERNPDVKLALVRADILDIPDIRSGLVPF